MSSQPLPSPLPPHEQSRANLYALLALLLLEPPDELLLQSLAQAPPLGGTADAPAGAPVVEAQAASPLGHAWDVLRTAALGDAEAIGKRFDALFVGTGQPLLNPYASLYLSGFLMDTPLALLRHSLAQLGLRRRRGVGEPEDHLGALCEAMELLITGAPPKLPPRTPAQQAVFFTAHLLPWAGRCLDDIEAADPGGFYAAVAGFMREFLTLEARAFALEEAAASED